MRRNDLLVSKVAPTMVTHVSLGPETLVAALVWAMEGPFVVMDALVDA